MRLVQHEMMQNDYHSSYHTISQYYMLVPNIFAKYKINLNAIQCNSIIIIYRIFKYQGNNLIPPIDVHKSMSVYSM